MHLPLLRNNGKRKENRTKSVLGIWRVNFERSEAP